jgi:hypothetical protein
VHLVKQLDVGHVLPGDLRYRDVQHVEILSPDQVQQQVQRPFKRIEEYFQRVGRDVEVQRHPGVGLTLHHREWHFLLPDSGSLGVFGLGYGGFHWVSLASRPASGV